MAYNTHDMVVVMMMMISTKYTASRNTHMGGWQRWWPGGYIKRKRGYDGIKLLLL